MTKILAIDDNNDNLISLKAISQDAFPDSVIYTALNGPKGIALAIDYDPDVILLDIIMPDIDGFEVCRLLKKDERVRDIPVVFLTAIKGDKENRIKALEAGAEGFLAKPIDETELTAQIRAMIKIKVANQLKRDEKSRLLRLVTERTNKLELSRIATLNLLEELKEENEMRRQTEDALRESEERFIHLFERAPLGYQSLDAEGRFIEVNEAWLTTLGYDRHEVIGLWFGSFLAPKYVDPFRQQSPFLQPQGRIHADFEVIHKNGQFRFIAFEGRIGHKQDGSFDKTHCILQDITESKKAEEALRESEKRYRLLVEQSPTGIAIHQKGLFVYVNPAGLAIFGAKDQDQLIGQPVLSVVHPDSRDEVTKRIKKVACGIAVPAIEEKLMRSDGSVFIAEVTALSTKFNDKSAGQVIVWDITERKRVEVELIAAKEKAEESDRLKSAFLANMSHEIRTPLNSIIGFSDLLADPFYEPQHHAEFARLIKKNGNNLLSIINDIMDLSKIEAGHVHVKKQLFSASQLIRDTQKDCSFKAMEKAIELRLDPPDWGEEIFINSDETKLRQVLVNCVGNAIKFTEKGFVEIGIKIQEHFVQFHVKDTGIGIPAEFHTQIFERFRQVESGHTRKYGGNGLGLPISKCLIELLGGTIWMESEMGMGSTFYFKVPLG